jgi:hypothetical protein
MVNSEIMMSSRAAGMVLLSAVPIVPASAARLDRPTQRYNRHSRARSAT